MQTRLVLDFFACFWGTCQLVQVPPAPPPPWTPPPGGGFSQHLFPAGPQGSSFLRPPGASKIFCFRTFCPDCTSHVFERFVDCLLRAIFDIVVCQEVLRSGSQLKAAPGEPFSCPPGIWSEPYPVPNNNPNFL